MANTCAWQNTYLPRDCWSLILIEYNAIYYLLCKYASQIRIGHAIIGVADTFMLSFAKLKASLIMSIISDANIFLAIELISNALSEYLPRSLASRILVLLATR